MINTVLLCSDDDIDDIHTLPSVFLSVSCSSDRQAEAAEAGGWTGMSAVQCSAGRNT